MGSEAAPSDDGGSGGAQQIFADVARAMADAGWDAFVKLGQGPVPDQLFVALEPDGRGRVLHLQVMLLQLGDLPALQYFVGLPYKVTSTEATALCRFLCALNPDLPIAGFEFSEAQGMLFFNHKHCITLESFRLDVLAWNTTMIDFLIRRFGPVIEAVASGLGYAEGRRQLVRLLAELADQPAASPPGA
jgi:hypothetical protein